MSRLGEAAPRRPPVRFGGRPTAAGYRFEISGGALCLDLANTLDQRPTASPRELLRRYRDLVAWGLQAGALEKADADALEALARRHPRRAARCLQRARVLRELLFGIFSAAARRKPLPKPELDRLNAMLPAALRHLRLAGEGRHAAWRWSDEGDLDRVTWPVIRSAAELLTTESLSRVRECASERCAWLFRDRSRNRTRRWCDMTVCGNREKARRFKQRARRGTLATAEGAARDRR